MGLAALKIPELCAHPFPTCDPAENVADTACFLLRRQIAGSPKMGATVARFFWRARGGRGWLPVATGTPRMTEGGRLGVSGVRRARGCRRDTVPGGGITANALEIA